MVLRVDEGAIGTARHCLLDSFLKTHKLLGRCSVEEHRDWHLGPVVPAKSISDGHLGKTGIFRASLREFLHRSREQREMRQPETKNGAAGAAFCGLSLEPGATVSAGRTGWVGRLDSNSRILDRTQSLPCNHRTGNLARSIGKLGPFSHCVKAWTDEFAFRL